MLRVNCIQTPAEDTRGTASDEDVDQEDVVEKNAVKMYRKDKDEDFVEEPETKKPKAKARATVGAKSKSKSDAEKPETAIGKTSADEVRVSSGLCFRLYIYKSRVSHNEAFHFTDL